MTGRDDRLSRRRFLGGAAAVGGVAGVGAFGGFGSRLLWPARARAATDLPLVAVSGTNWTVGGTALSAPLKGANVHPGLNTTYYQTLKDKGFGYVRMALVWGGMGTGQCLQPSDGTSIDTTYEGLIDGAVAACYTAGLYVIFNVYYGPASDRFPANWATIPPGQNFDSVECFTYQNQGQWITQKLANRYGSNGAGNYANPNTVIGFQINEPGPGDTPSDPNPNRVRYIFSEQNTIFGWYQTPAPNWIGFASAGFGANAAYPDAPNSGHSDDLFAAPDSSLFTVPVTLDLHHYLKGIQGNPTRADGRNQYGSVISSGPGYAIKVDDPTYHAYPPDGDSTANCQACMNAYAQSHAKAASVMGVPWIINESGFTPIDSSYTNPTQHATDLGNAISNLPTKPVGHGQWIMDTSPSSADPWSMYDVTNPSPENPYGYTDHWQDWTTQMISQTY